MMEDDIKRVLFSEDEIKAKCRELGAVISRDYAGTEPVFIGVLKGCFIFMADLIRNINIYSEIDFMAVSSYGDNTSTTGAVRIGKDLSRDIEGKHVVLVEDILDSGITLSYLKKYLGVRKPASIKI